MSRGRSLLAFLGALTICLLTFAWHTTRRHRHSTSKEDSKAKQIASAGISQQQPSEAAPLKSSEHLAEILETTGDLSIPANRRKALERSRNQDATMRQRLLERAQQAGIPVRNERPDATIRELIRFEGDQAIYYTTYNANAAISTGANLLQLSPYAVTGAGLAVGVWDGGAVLATHRELAGRVSVLDGAAPANHSTHVGGTIAASGVSAAAKGMAPDISLLSSDWDADVTEMLALGASYPQEPDTIPLSNHSYGVASGWGYTGLTSPEWEWFGNGTTNASIEQDFGVYNASARDADSLGFGLPYYLIVRAAGNDRSDNPAEGDNVTLSPNSTSVVLYSATTHPAGDGRYRNGYDTIGYDACAKNVLTVGAVTDAVTTATRDKSKATITSFSSWGPTDDGRIKPDLVANGYSLYSMLSGSDTGYGYYSGTSMATPNVTGTAALIVDYVKSLFPDLALRSATLKALLIHTADDLGNVGPDYQHGWGLVNAQAAADLLRDYKQHPGTRRLIESRLTTSSPTYSQTFTWNGNEPIRATLVWLDPAGTATTSSDSRTARLVNDLNLTITGPNGQTHLPWVMPFTSDWTLSTYNAPATRGVNQRDNVEQVLIDAPTAGLYTVEVRFANTLTNDLQRFALVLSGGSNTDVAPLPLLTSVSPISHSNSGEVTLSLEGANLLVGGEVSLQRSGESSVIGSGLEVSGDLAKVRVNATGMAPGIWSVAFRNPDGSEVLLSDRFTITEALWSDNVDGMLDGWTTESSSGTSQWAISSTHANSLPNSYFSPGSASVSDTSLITPSIEIPPDSHDLQLTFWQDFNFRAGEDGGVLEYSVNSGPWIDVYSSPTTTFLSNGYNSTLNTSSSNPLYGRTAWSGSSGGFHEVRVELTDTMVFAGSTLRFRWRLATDRRRGSVGWYVDDITLSASSSVNLPPSITLAATASPVVVFGNSTELTVSANDDGGEDSLSYHWSVNDDFNHPVTFSENGSHVARVTVATFSKAGTYSFLVTVTDPEGLSATSQVDVEVNQTASALTIAPSEVTLETGSSQWFTATVDDQFALPMATQPSMFAWAANGGGTIEGTSEQALFTAGNQAGGPFIVNASAGGLDASSQVTLVAPPPVIHTLTIVADPATGGTVLGAGDYEAGSTVIVTATASDGWVFNAWSGDGLADPNASTTTVIVDGNKSITAHFTVDDPYARWIESHGITGDDALASADPDGDGCSNETEFLLGFDPVNSNEHLDLAVNLLPDGSWEFTVNRVISTGTFVIESSDKPTSAWEDYATLVVTTDRDNYTLPMPDSSDLRRFFRVRFVP